MNLPRYRDPAASIEERVDDLLSAMTLDEKIAQLACLWSPAFVREGSFDADFAAAQMPHGIGQVTRIGAATGLRPRESAAFMNAIQRVAVERTRLGIPIFVHEESTGGYCARDATVFPQGLGLAATWDPVLVGEVAGVIREQLRAVGARLALAPVMDVARDPRWGRVEETYGEDPVLAGALAVAYVRSLQTDDVSHGVIATGKHFLGYALSEGGRNWAPVQLGPRELREVYAEPFAAAVRDGGIAAMMNSYASVDGMPCCASRAIFTDLLRDELGFDGGVVSDYVAIPALQSYHRVAASAGEAARLALTAGIDMELPTQECYGGPLKAEVEAGRLSVELVDVAVRRVLRLKFRLGLFEQPYVDAEAAPSVFDTLAQRALARTAAAESVVLLANDGVLPLAPTVRRLAVIGPGADDPRLLQGDYHYPAHVEIVCDVPQGLIDSSVPPRAGGDYAPGSYYTPHVTPLVGLKAALGDQAEILHARGCDVLGVDRSGFDEAVAAARSAEVTIAVVAGKSGLKRPATVGEFNDAANLDLTGVQQELLDALARTGTPLVVVVLSGRIHTLARVAACANALLYLCPPGEEGGNGLSGVLTGAVNPSGRLPVTLPRSVGQVPIYAGHRAGGDRVMMLGDYVDSPTTPLFPFGHGLSYTSFSYADFAVRPGSTTQPTEIAVTVRNSGARAGTEVVQLYVRDEVASVARPDRMLIGFARLPLEPGQACRLAFTVHPSRLAFFDPLMRFVVEPGEFTFSVGASATDIRAMHTVPIEGEEALHRQRDIVATTTRVLE